MRNILATGSGEIRREPRTKQAFIVLAETPPSERYSLKDHLLDALLLDNTLIPCPIQLSKDQILPNDLSKLMDT